jgi:hypothetical protein
MENKNHHVISQRNALRIISTSAIGATIPMSLTRAGEMAGVDHKVFSADTQNNNLQIRTFHPHDTGEPLKRWNYHE